MPVIRMKFITRQFIQDHPDWLFLFGDNERRQGMGGQARHMRGEPNSIGVATKHSPTSGPSDFWSDAKIDHCKRVIDQDLVPAFKAVKDNKTVVIPEDGLGTGLSELPERAPQVFAYLEQQLKKLEDL